MYPEGGFTEATRADPIKGSSEGDKETMNENIRRQSGLYQLYTPTLKDITTVKLRIGGSENIKSGNSKYFVRVLLFKHFIEKYVETTSKTSPHWNEVLTFHISKQHLLNLEIESVELDFMLMEHDSEKPIKRGSKSCKLIEIILNPKVIFKGSSGKKIYITKVEFEYEPDVRVRKQLQLCVKEKTFFEKRRQIVYKTLKEQKSKKFQGLDNLKHVPNIAVIGSGGGMRAVVGMCGAMIALEDLGILNAAMYTAGVSGSAWYVSTLYANKSGFNPREVKNSIQKRLSTAPETFISFLFSCFEDFHNLDEKSTKTLTDIYGNKVGAILLGQNHQSKWSDLGETLQHAELPLPLLAAVHVNDSHTIQDFHDWIECSPYEVFMPKYGTGIDMKYFGSEFNGGFVTKRNAEQSIQFLQGVCGSAYAVLLAGYEKGNQTDGFFERLKKKFVDKCLNYFQKEGLGKVPNWLHGIVNFDSLVKEENGFNLSNAMKEVIDVQKPEMTLADAGTVCNSPYPLVLHPTRNVDVILSFDFSQNYDLSTYNFGELKIAAEWAKRRGINFPKVDNGGKLYKENKAVRVFQNDNTPCIIHFIMNDEKFLKENKPGLTPEECLATEGYDMAYFNTLKLRYSALDFKWLSKLMEFNVKDHEDCIRECIQNAINRRGNHQVD